MEDKTLSTLSEWVVKYIMVLTYNFQEIYEFLIKNNISKVVWNSDELNYLKDDLENNKKTLDNFLN